MNTNKQNSIKKEPKKKKNDIDAFDDSVKKYGKLDISKAAQIRKNTQQTNETKKKSNTKSEDIKKDSEKKKGKSDSVKNTNEQKKKKNTANSRRRSGAKNASVSMPVKIGFLGGLNEVGKNLTAIEYGEDIIIIDCGLAFPDSTMLGVDLVIPDFTYIEKNKEKIRGIFVTHGHEDHIGGIPYLLDVVNVPLYSTQLTIGLIEAKLKEAKKLSKAKLKVISAGDKIKAGGFSVEAIHMNHSIPDALAFAIKCGAGTLVHTGDFKIDCTPIDGGMADLARLGELGNEGVLCLMSDSTNSERPGYTESERKVGESFENLFRKAGQRRLIVATFASNIHRVQQIINVAESLGRKVALSGRSLENVVAIGQQLGYLNVPKGIIIGIDAIKQYADNELVLITTGSQGEPMSALTRMAMSDHRKVSIGPNDCVIISANPIPGNEKTVGNVINELMKLGAHVVYERMYDVHVSGHACQEEQKIILGLVKPKYFIPVHGEQKHLQKHALTGQLMGIPASNIIITSNGNCISLFDDTYTVTDIPSGNVFVDGYGVGDVGSVVLRDRKLLSEDGIIVVSIVLDSLTGYLVSEPQIYSKGFIFMKESSELFSEMNSRIVRVTDSYSDKGRHDINSLRNKVRDDLSRFVYDRTKKSPVILPVISEV